MSNVVKDVMPKSEGNNKRAKTKPIGNEFRNLRIARQISNRDLFFAVIKIQPFLTIKNNLFYVLCYPTTHSSIFLVSGENRIPILTMFLSEVEYCRA